ncbi:hypothetical protein AAF712_001213 [Marasmius tenuissimus]|uniref:Uncharacterized protein n=1 Tax=Marasmius tenuissimus TaxID=585030 RepID=A0ABR3ADA6_9AGAR
MSRCLSEGYGGDQRQVTWLKGNAFDPSTFSHILPEVGGVVHTIGTLFEDGGVYKAALREGDVPKLVGGFFNTVMENINGSNPLAQKQREGSYERLNRDSALRVCEAFVQSGEGKAYPKPRPFVFISAEDFSRPIIPSRYIETKREAEQGIGTLVSRKPDQYRGVYIRPTLFDLSAALHTKGPPGVPKPADVLRRLGNALSPRSLPPENHVDLGSTLESVANALTIPPIHVDHVGDAVAVALQLDSVRGPVGVQMMRELIGWDSMKS